MNRVASAGIAAAAALAVGGLLWMGLGRRAQSGQEKGTAPAAQEPMPQNPAHERASLEALLRKKPGHGSIVLRLAQLDEQEGKPAEARARLEEFLRGTPGDAAAWLELGKACYEMGDKACALRSTSRALELEPGNADALYNLGAMEANEGRVESAEHYWKRVLETAPDSDSGRKAAAALREIRRTTRK